MPASLNQSDGQSERPPQTCFLTLHFPVIAFVIVPSEMKESVQGKNSDFFGYRMPQSTCVIRSNLRRNRHISSEPLRQPKRCGKRQHIRWFILTAETMIQSLQLPATSDQHIDGPSNSGRPLRAGYKLRQRRLIQPHDSLLNDNQAFSRGNLVQINRRAMNRSPPIQPCWLYSLASACAGAIFCCKVTLSVPFVLPFTPLLGSSKDSCCSASLVLCSS